MFLGCNCTSIEWGGSGYSTFQYLSYAADVTYLYIHDTGITWISATEMRRYTSLRTFYLRGNDDLTNMPDLSRCTPLEIFDGAENAINHVPRDAFVGLTLLGQINLNDNQLTGSTTELVMPTEVDRLNIHDNALTSLTLVKGTGTTKFREIKCSDNQLTSLPVLTDFAATLQHIICTSNQIDYIHIDQLAGFSKLVTLFLNDNPIRHISDLKQIPKQPDFNRMRLDIRGVSLACDSAAAWMKTLPSSWEFWIDEKPCIGGPAYYLNTYWNNIPYNQLNQISACVDLPNCGTCTDFSSCAECDLGWFQDESNVCQTCAVLANCVQCVDTDTCVICVEGYYSNEQYKCSAKSELLNFQPRITYQREGDMFINANETLLDLPDMRHLIQSVTRTRSVVTCAITCTRHVHCESFQYDDVTRLCDLWSVD